MLNEKVIHTGIVKLIPVITLWWLIIKFVRGKYTVDESAWIWIIVFLDCNIAKSNKIIPPFTDKGTL